MTFDHARFNERKGILSYGSRSASDLARRIGSTADQRLGVSIYHPRDNGLRADQYDRENENSYLCNFIRRGRLSNFVNWGCHRNVLGNYSRCVNFNAVNAVDKVEAYRRFTDNGIVCPRIVDPTTYNGLFFGRQNERHAGYGIRIFRRPQSSAVRERYDFFTALVETVEEFRLHVWMGRVISANEKVRDEPPVTDRDRYIRSHRLGWRMPTSTAWMNTEDDVVREAHTIAIRAVTALSLDFGAVDMFIQPDGTIGVFEVNSAPGLDNYHQKVSYAEAIWSDLGL